MWDGYTKAQQALIEKVDGLARNGFAGRAAEYDRAAQFPEQDVRDFHQAGLLLSTLNPDQEGGLGYGFHGTDPLALFIMIERMAMVSPATSHCLQVHLNTIQLIRYFCNDDQCARYLAPTRAAARLTVGAGSEPGGGGLGGTLATPVDGGYRVTGKKHYATNATFADWLWVFAVEAGTGAPLQFAVHRDAEGLTIDESFWDPVGMRACVSPMVILEDCFVPMIDVMGDNQRADFFTSKWLAKINLGFTANYIGSLQGILDWIVGYLRDRGRGSEQVYESAIGELKARIDGARLLLYNAVAYSRRDEDGGLMLANSAKYMAIDAIRRMLLVGGQITGSTALFRKHPLERMLRDLHVHVLHKRHHVGAGLIGQQELELPYDLNFS